MHDKKMKTCAIENSIISICKKYIKNINRAPRLNGSAFLNIDICEMFKLLFKSFHPVKL